MRRLVLLCSAFAFLCVTSAAGAQTQPVASAQPATAKKGNAKHAAGTRRAAAPQKNAAQPAPPPVDTRPRYKRDDVPAAVAAPTPAPAASAVPSRRAAAPASRVAPPAPAAAAQEPAPPVVDTRPRLKRDDLPAPVVAAPAKPVVATRKHHLARKPAVGVQPAAAARTPRATTRDVAACVQTKDHDAAIAGCSHVIDDQKQKPKGRASAYYNRGNAYAAKGEHLPAIADYDEAIRLDPKGSTALNNRGTAKSESGDLDGAIADFGEAIALNKKFASAYFNRANAYAAKGEADKAIEDYTAAIKNNRRNINAYIARGALYLATNSVANAHADVTLAARMERRNAYAVLWEDIVERRAKQKGVLAKGTKGLDMKAWPAPVIRLFTGEIKQDAVLSAADNPNPAVKLAQSCEANFYGGQYALIADQREDAVKLFEAAAKECPHGFLEGIAASAELKGMGQKVGAN
jgi:lipoprotein NlpI